MNTALSAPAATTGTESRSLNGALPQAQQFDSASAVRSSESSDMPSLDSGMTDEQREQAAYRAGVAMHVWYAEFQRTGDLRCLDIAYRHMGQQVAILKGARK